MSGEHTHQVPLRAGTRFKGRLTVALVLVATFMVVEVVAGFLTNSLALLSDAGHMATDALGLGMALAAIMVADRADSSGGHTFGLYRLEIIAALANAMLLFAVAGYVVYEAIQRLGQPPEVLSGSMLVVAAGGLAVNVVGWWLLRPGAAESINLEGAYLEVLADLIGSIGVIIAALIIRFTGWMHADALFGVAIGLFILPRAWRLARRSLRIMIQAAPQDLDLDQVQTDLVSIDGVSEVHDLHVWTLTSGMDVASAHLIASEPVDPHTILDRASTVLREQYGIAHATLQIEPDTHRECTEVAW